MKSIQYLPVHTPSTAFGIPYFDVIIILATSNKFRGHHLRGECVKSTTWFRESRSLFGSIEGEDVVDVDVVFGG